MNSDIKSRVAGLGARLQALPPLRRIGLTMVVGLIAGFGYALFATWWYRAAVTVMPSKSNKGAFGQLGAAAGDALGGMGGLLSLSEGEDIDRIAAVIQSRSVSDAVIQRFDLLTRYNRPYIEFARDELWAHCTVKAEAKGGTVTLACEDKDPEFAREMVQFFADTARETFKRVNSSRLSEQVRFLEGHVQQLRESADESARALRDFEEKNKIVDLEEQGKAVVSALASIKGTELTRELQLDYLNGFSSADETTARQIRRQLSVLGSKYVELENPGRGKAQVRSEKPPSATAAGDLFPAALAVPQLRYDLQQLGRERKFRETALFLTMQRLEIARADEAGETSTFQILDPPVKPTYKDRPKRALIVVLGLVLGLFAGVAWIKGPHYLRRALDELSAEPG
jgi:uncharacterized protein involved in exopolysaccharide biosynthesis